MAGNEYGCTMPDLGSICAPETIAAVGRLGICRPFLSYVYREVCRAGSGDGNRSVLLPIPSMRRIITSSV